MRKRLFTYDLTRATVRACSSTPRSSSRDGEASPTRAACRCPGYHFEIVRPERVTVRGLDLDGNEIVLEGDELLGRMIQHEIDHLDGVLLLDRLEPEVRREALRELRTRELSAHDPTPRSARDRGL